MVHLRSNHGPITVQSRPNHGLITAQSRSNHDPITVQSRVVSTLRVYLGTAHSRQLPEHPGQQGPVAQQRRGYESPVSAGTDSARIDRSIERRQSVMFTPLVQQQSVQWHAYCGRRYTISATSGPLYEYDTCRPKLSYSSGTTCRNANVSCFSRSPQQQKSWNFSSTTLISLHTRRRPPLPTASHTTCV